MSATLVDDPAVVAKPITTPAPALRANAGAPVLPLPLARLIGFTALAAWGALHWMQLLEPAEPGRAWLVLLVGVIAAGMMLAAGRLTTTRARTLAAVGALVPIVALMLLAG